MNFVKASLSAISAVGLGGTVFGEPMKAIPLWEGKPPGEEQQIIGEEKSEDANNDGITRISNVSKPTITVYPAPEEKRNGAAVVVAPGGGYHILASSHEGTDVCKWLNENGITAILLKYRVPRREGIPKHQAALQDAQRAVSMVRANAKDWKIDPNRLGFLGFSAGGHLTAMTLTSGGEVTFPKSEVDKHSPVPNFGVLIYPAYLQSESDPNSLPADVKVNEKTPPCFVAVAHGDRKWVEGAAIFYLAMRRAERQCELHIYGKGGHGFGMKKISERAGQWPKAAAGWMKEQGILEEK